MPGDRSRVEMAQALRRRAASYRRLAAMLLDRNSAAVAERWSLDLEAEAVAAESHTESECEQKFG